MSINDRRTPRIWRHRRWLWSAGDVSDFVEQWCYLMLRFLKAVIVVSIFLLLPLEVFVRMVLFTTNTNCSTVTLLQTRVVEDVCAILPPQRVPLQHKQQQKQQRLQTAEIPIHDLHQQQPIQPKPSHIMATTYFYYGNPAFQFLHEVVHDRLLLLGGSNSPHRHANDKLENTSSPPEPTSSLAPAAQIDGRMQVHRKEEGQPSPHPLQQLLRVLLRRNGTRESSNRVSSSSATVTTTLVKEYPFAFSRPLVVTEAQLALIHTLSHRVHETIPDFLHRVNHVAWGGPGGPKWYHPTNMEHHLLPSFGSSHPKHVSLDTIDGGRLLYSYLRIMKWPQDLARVAHIPIQLCHGRHHHHHGEDRFCDATVSIAHTLEFREKFQPWHVTPAAIRENRVGFVYHRGFSRSDQDDGNNTNNNKRISKNKNISGRHSLIWFRPGIHKREDSMAYLRAMIYSLERAIADSLRESNHRVGKFNVIIDTHGFSVSMMPRLWEVKVGIKILQEHLPDRLGMVFLVNLSHAAELAFNVVKPFLSKEVRSKIRIVPHDHDKKLHMLETVMEPKYIPIWLGGTDNYQFQPDTYYPQHLHITDQRGLEYLQTMPYHAP